MRLGLVQLVRAVRVEVAEDQRVDVVELVERGDERFGRDLRRAVGIRLDAERISLAQRQRLRRAIDGRAGREDDLADVHAAHRFEQADGVEDVVLGKDERLFDRARDLDEGRHVDDGVVATQPVGEAIFVP